MEHTSLTVLVVFACLSTPLPAARADDTAFLEPLADTPVVRPDDSFTQPPSRIPGPYSSNVWELYRFDNRIYIGTGNSSDFAPSTDPGPSPVASYDLRTRTINQEAVIIEGQIDVFREINGQLVIPGHDPVYLYDTVPETPAIEGAPPSFHRLEDRGWVSIAMNAGQPAHHVYDIASFDGKLWLALGVDFMSVYNDLLSSDNNGASWSPVASAVDPRVRLPYRFHDLFEFNGVLYASGHLTARVTTNKFPLWSSDGTTETLREDLNGEAFGPDTVAGIAEAMADDVRISIGHLRITRPVVFRGELVYLFGAVHNDHQVWPMAVYRAASLQRGAVDVRLVDLGPGAPEWVNGADRVSLAPEDRTPAGTTDWTPWDLVVRDDVLYVLMSRPRAASEREEQDFDVKVWATRDLEQWHEITTATFSTFARALEVDEGDLYFGLGTDVGLRYGQSYTLGLEEESGKIYRLAREDWSTCGDGWIDLDGGESCDDGSDNSDERPNACRTDCTLSQDGRRPDAGVPDGGASDSGLPDDGSSEGGARADDAATGDGSADSGRGAEAPGELDATSGGGCATAGGGKTNAFVWALGFLLLSRSRRRRRSVTK